jgi:hypothetical protein
MVPISPPFDIACPIPEATIPVKFREACLKGICITHWPKEGEPGLVIDGNGMMRPKFLERQMNLSFKAEKDGSIERKIRRERLRMYRRN